MAFLAPSPPSLLPDPDGPPVDSSVGVVIATDHHGGAEQYLMDLYARLRGEGVAGSLLGRLPGWADTDLPHADVGLGPKWSRRRLARTAVRAPIETGQALARISAIHRNRPFDRFHAQFKREQLLLTPALARLAPVVWTEHGRFATFRGSEVLRRAYRLAAGWTDTIICVSNEVAGEVEAIAGPRAAIQVVENAVDDTVFHPARTEADRDDRRQQRAALGVADGQLLAVVTSRLHRAKGIDQAVAAAQAAGVRLVVAGDGPDADRLRALAGDTAVFVGHQSRPQVARLLRAADLFFYCPAPTEGSSLAVLEAAATGLALVAVTTERANPGVGYVLAGGGAVLPTPGAVADWLPTADLVAAGVEAQALAADHSLADWLARHRAILAAG